ncbi:MULTISPECIES: hypothetical protein [Streptomyces]|uniref:Secreted protein n=2 Tax=Streptomyces TaxID=1883 RepID=A0ABS9JNH0_9ACTN|nr:MULTISPECIES: hypothetical protein [Streptomyces]CUW28576.1 hypothetical protein TUE45_03316 [Streptomyces reticuli]AKN70638.1 hypothetical protein QR97_13125 [Streptomyces sp. PBH53]MCE0444705.1 hypothetical protein [Streptomyces tricolor]MCG0067119.1 hypothetical protein [Streptomyces tricolor]OYP17523.1 hypothetical protein CFC35_25990 [Streptomyces sp. FBKL.4005]
MKPTTRGTLAAVVTGVAATVGAAGPAAAAGTVPVPVPLGGVSHALDMELPRLGAELPLLKPGAPEGPRYVTGRLLPDRALPQLPVSSGLPGLDARAPLPHVLGDGGFDHLDVDAPAGDLRALAPGLSVDAPLTAPDGDNFGLPSAKLPEAGVVAPVLQTVAGGNLATGPGL